MRTTPPAMPAYGGFDEAASSDGVVNLTFSLLLFLCLTTILMLIYFFFSIGPSWRGHCRLWGTIEGCEMEWLSEAYKGFGRNTFQSNGAGHLLGDWTTLESRWNCNWAASEASPWQGQSTSHHMWVFWFFIEKLLLWNNYFKLILFASSVCYFKIPFSGRE